jgi:hypothetical protein
MRAFHLQRIEDEGGVSGTGRVAEGVEFANGWCALVWLTKHTSCAFYQSISEVEAIHGHNGRTLVVFEPPHAAALEAVRIVGLTMGLAKEKVFDDHAYFVLSDAHEKLKALVSP